MFQKLIFTLIFLISINIYAQNEYLFSHKFTYLLTYQPDSTNVNYKQTEEMFLWRNNNVSIFQSKNGYVKDSLLLNIKDKPVSTVKMLDISRFPKTQFHYKILKVSQFMRKFIPIIFVIANLKKHSLENKPDLLKVNGLRCQKATTSYAGRDYIAWFTPIKS